jgi:hypothetical protein
MDAENSITNVAVAADTCVFYTPHIKSGCKSYMSHTGVFWLCVVHILQIQLLERDANHRQSSNLSPHSPVQETYRWFTWGGRPSSKRKGPMIVPPPIPRRPPIVPAVTADPAYITSLLTPQFKSVNVYSSSASWCVFDAIWLFLYNHHAWKPVTPSATGICTPHIKY